MIRESITIDDAIAVLNDALRCDGNAMHKLTGYHVPCLPELAQHPTIQVASNNLCDVGIHHPGVGMLGVINGMFGIDEDSRGPICAKYDDDGGLIGFDRAANYPVAAPADEPIYDEGSAM